MKMKFSLIGLAALALIVSASTAQATSCAQRAENCKRLGGGASCSEVAPMKQCRASKIYTAPSGRTWEANDR
jgi:hypothetical protein